MTKAAYLHGEQLAFELEDARVSVPWSGRSPRGLTRGANLFILKAWPQKSVSDPMQTEMFEYGLDLKVRIPYLGAPLLLPLGGVA